MLDHILVPLDGSPLAESALPHAVALALAFNSQLTLLRVVDQSAASQSVDPLDWHIEKTEADSYLDSVTARLQARNIAIEKVLLEGRPTSLIVDFAKSRNVDLVVLSAHGKSGLNDGSLGSVVQKIINTLDRSIMLVHSFQPIAMHSDVL